MKEILSLNDKRAKRAPQDVRVEAEQTGKDVLHIVWDEADGYPKHAWGYEQWSVRPFTQMQGCDGTIDGSVHYLGIQLCQAIGLDYAAIYDQAYPNEVRPGETGAGDWLRRLDWRETARQTIIPRVSKLAFERLLDDLGDINNHQLRWRLGEALEEKYILGDTPKEPTVEQVRRQVTAWRKKQAEEIP